MTPETQVAILKAHRQEGPPEPWDRDGCTAQAVLGVVAQLSGISKAELVGRRRTRKISRARQIVYALIREFRPAMTWEEVASVLGKDRTSACHALAILPAVMRSEPSTRQLYDEAKKRLAAE